MRPRTAVWLAATVIALFATVAPSLVSAEDADEGSTELRTTILHPGDNFVGWVAEPKPVAELFAEFPQIELIYTWDPEGRSYRSGSRNGGGTLTALEPGMAANIRIAGDEPVEWERPVTPAKGGITLYRGVNWVTWLGREEWPLDQVVRGIGSSLISIRVGNVTWPAPLDDSVDNLPTLRRGDAVEVTVSRDVNWLQPTGLMPRIVFAGGAGQEQEDRITDDVGSTIDFFAEHYGIEADASTLTIYVWTRYDDLIATGSHFENYRLHYEANPVGAGSVSWEGYFAPTRIMLTPGSGRYTITHEYTHVIQHQLHSATRYGRPGGTAAWFTEGTAMHAENLHRIVDGVQSESSVLSNLAMRAAAPEAPPLKEAERNVTGWHYVLGHLATTWLVQNFGTDVWIELWRHHLPQRIGPHGAWQSSLPFQEILEVALGVSIDDYYQRFEARRAGLPSANVGLRDDRYSISGTVRDTSGKPLAGLTVSDLYSNPSCGRKSFVVTDTSGRYEIDGLGACGYIISVLDASQFGALFFSNKGNVESRWQATPLHVIDGDVHGIDFTVPDTLHTKSSKVTIVGPDDAPLGGLLVWLNGPKGGTRYRTSGDGVFRIPVGAIGTQRLGIELAPGCILYVAEEGLVTEQWRALGFAPGSQSGSDLRVRVGAEQCVHRVEGRVMDPTGEAWSGLAASRGVVVRADGEEGNVQVSTRSSGDFTVTLPGPGRYRISAAVDACTVYYDADGVTGSRDLSARVDSRGSGLESVDILVPEDVCVDLRGRVVAPSSNESQRIWLNLHNDEVSMWRWSSPDGMFTFKVRAGASYELSHWSGSCRMYYAGNGIVSNAPQEPLMIATKETAGTEIVFRLPEDPASFCD